ncbi:MAG: rhodanese-like domain-containing protein [Ekhidna sp.]
MRESSTKNDKLVLASLSFVLAGLALAIASPNGLNGANRQPNFMGVIELAEKIKNRENLLLIDLRDAQKFEEMRIPTAKNIPFDSLDLGELKGTTIFYSGDDLLSRKLWDSLPDSLRDQTIILYGGMRDWYDRMLYPTLPFGDQVSDSSLLKHLHELCEFYGGFADFEPDSSLLNYYQLDLSTAKWPKIRMGNKLMRKGC